VGQKTSEMSVFNSKFNFPKTLHSVCTYYILQVYSFNTVTSTSFINTWVHGFILRHFGIDCILKSCILRQNESMKNEKDRVRSFQRSSMFLMKALTWTH